MDDLPRFSSDLIDLLDDSISAPTFDGMTSKGWGAIDEAALRRMAFQAGQRALVDLLRDAQADMENEKGDADVDSTQDGLDESPYEQVLDPYGEQRRDVASVHMATEITG